MRAATTVGFAPTPFERRLWVGLVCVCVLLVALLVGLGLWLERPFAARNEFASPSLAGDGWSSVETVSKESR
jgi:hypothetical protein